MVDIKDAKTGKIIAKNAIICSSYWSKARGLMLSRRKNLVFVFPWSTRVRLHMLFVLFPIDVIGLDSRLRVVCTGRLKPFRFWRATEPCTYIIELSQKPYSVPKEGSKLKIPGLG